jgi:signal peptidase II
LKKAVIIILLILIADQVLKIWVKTSMLIGSRGEITVLGDWFILHFTENEGMAFGMKFGGEFGKITLSIFRIIAVMAIGWYLYRLTKRDAPFGFVLSIALILAGALGNIIDSAFYGMIFSESTFHEVARIFPEEGGYSSFLHGKVVDMFYFPVITGYYPDWFPFWGGSEFIFFRPVFNIADSSITVGVSILILFQKKFFKKESH